METTKKQQTKQSFDSLSPVVWRASTVVFDSLEDFVQRKHRQPDGFSYGVTGTPTARNLEAQIARLEGANHCVITPSGASALMTTIMGFVRGGDHLLISAACYGSLKAFADGWLSKMGIEVEYFNPVIGLEIGKNIKQNTKMICLESPGTITMEMQDIPAIVEVARRHKVLTMIDNTWASPLGFSPLAHGVDFSIQAATKFMGGHSDLLMGSISMNDFANYSVLREAQSTLGQQVSPEDCFLVMRGLETLEVRLKTQSQSTLEIARWLQAQPAVQEIFYPPLESDPGHSIWKRDFKTNGCLFSLVLKPAEEISFHHFFDSLKTFVIGASWGGVHSLAAYYPAALQKNRLFSRTDQPVIRLSIGLESTDTLISDLSNALNAFENGKATS